MGRLFDFITSKSKEEKQKSLNQKMDIIQKEIESIDPVEELEKFKVESPNIKLEENEVCYYMGIVHPFKLKQSVARSSRSKGISVKIMNGLWYHTGGSETSPIIQQYCDYSEGTLFITNRRYVLTSPKYGFNLKIPKIINLEIHDNGFELYEGNNCHFINGIGGEDLYRLIQLMNAADRIRVEKEEKLERTAKKESPKKDDDKFKEVREYKKLLDEGIISEEEYEIKRKEILSL
ncbi:MAG: SHOCT domain-containing protein [Bacillota bacterium]|nr:SHOCT domain-containing protein [Bacillota bacterium]